MYFTEDFFLKETCNQGGIVEKKKKKKTCSHCFVRTSQDIMCSRMVDFCSDCHTDKHFTYRAYIHLCIKVLYKHYQHEK